MTGWYPAVLALAAPLLLVELRRLERLTTCLQSTPGLSETVAHLASRREFIQTGIPKLACALAGTPLRLEEPTRFACGVPRCPVGARRLTARPTPGTAPGDRPH
jgi:hypothetical protein